MVADVRIFGGKEIQLALKALGDSKATDRSAKSILRAGAKIVWIDARARVRKKSGFTHDKIKIRTSGGGRRIPTASVKSEGQLSYIIEYGTAPRVLKRPRWVNLKGTLVFITHTGRMPPSPFMRPAYENNKDAVLESMLNRSLKAIQLQARKLAKRRAAAIGT